MNIVWPTEQEVDVVDSIRGAIGRDVTFYVATVSGCSVCNLDPVTNTSTDSFCLVCSGLYWITTFSGYTVSGHITWGNLDQVNWVTGGQYFDGDCRVQIKYIPETVTIVDRVIEEKSKYGSYVLVDGKVLEIKSKILRGVKELNRIILTLIEKEA